MQAFSVVAVGWGLFSSCGVKAPYGSGFSCCGGQSIERRLSNGGAQV